LTKAKDEYLKRLYGESKENKPLGVVTSTATPRYMDATHMGIDSGSLEAVKLITVQKLSMTSEGLIELVPVQPQISLQAKGEVYSLLGGKVLKVKQGNKEGDDGTGVSVVSIWNPDLKRVFIYLHLSQVAPLLYEGQWINPGAWIGFEGATGYTNKEIHTHVEVHPYFDVTAPPTNEEAIAGFKIKNNFSLHYQNYDVEDPFYTMKLAKDTGVWDKSYNNNLIF
jgi:hypothetical protein